MSGTTITGTSVNSMTGTLVHSKTGTPVYIMGTLVYTMTGTPVYTMTGTSDSKSTSYSGGVLAVALIAEFVVIAIGIAIVGIVVVSFKRRWKVGTFMCIWMLSICICEHMCAKFESIHISCLVVRFL